MLSHPQVGRPLADGEPLRWLFNTQWPLPPPPNRRPSLLLRPSYHATFSLDEQNKRHQRQLSRHLSDAAPELAGRLRKQRSEQKRVSPAGVSYFAEGDGAAGDEPAHSGLVLPSFGGLPPAVRATVLAQLCNQYLQNEAEQVGRWGWWDARGGPV